MSSYGSNQAYSIPVLAVFPWLAKSAAICRPNMCCILVIRTPHPYGTKTPEQVRKLP